MTQTVEVVFSLMAEPSYIDSVAIESILLISPASFFME
jgi:hypothetical protein